MTTSKKKNTAAYISVLIGNSIFGFSFMFSRVALNAARPFVMLMYRFIIAFLGMTILALWSRKTKRQDWLRFSLKPRESGILIVFGLVQPVLYFLFESYGISMTNATVSGVTIALVPIVALGAGAIFLKEIPSLRQVLFSALSILGVIVMTLQQSAGGAIQPLGVVFLIGAVISGVTFNIMTRSLSSRFSAFERTYVMMLVACVSFIVLALFDTRLDPEVLFAPLKDASFIGALLYLSVLSSIVAYLLINHASTVLPVGKISSFCNLSTVLSVFAGVVFLGETINFVSLIAAAVIVIGVFFVQKS